MRAATHFAIAGKAESFRSDRKDRGMKGADAAVDRATAGADDALASKFGVRSLLCDFYLRFYKCAEYNPPVSAKGVPRGHMLQ